MLYLKSISDLLQKTYIIRFFTLVLLIIVISAKVPANKANIAGTLRKAEYYSVRNPDSAIYLLKSVPEPDALETPESLAAYHYLFAKAYMLKRDYNRAYASVLKSLATGEIPTGEEDYINALLLAGNISVLLQKYETAQLYIEKAKQVTKHLKDSTIVAEIYLLEGKLYEMKDEYNLALDFFHKALNLAVHNKKYTLMSRCYLNAGVVYVHYNEYQLAAGNYYKALKISKENKDFFTEAEVFTLLGALYKEKDEYQKALRSSFAALSVYRKIEDTIGIAYSCNTIGELYESKDSVKKAEWYYLKSAETGNKYDYNPIKSKVMLNLGTLYFKQGQTDKALSYLDESISAALKSDDKKTISSASEYLGSIYYDQGKYAKAYHLLLKHKILSDSLINSEKREEIAKRKMKYEFDQEQRKLDYQTRQRNILFQSKLKEFRFYRNISVAIALLVVAIAVILIYIYRFRQSAKEHDMKEELSVYMQKTLIQQMNPHFMFNVLNTIQNYIFQNDKTSSVKFISKFAELMKVTLYNSKYNIIPIKQEIEGITLYIDLEKSTLKNGFRYQFKVDKSIETGKYFIPSFIFQPIVENAIKHGLMNKKGTDKNIDIEIKLDGDLIRCSVEDNGIGREQASVKRIPGHKSVATNLTRKRIELLGQYYKCDLSIRYIDLKNNEGVAAGTRVEFELPVITSDLLN